MAAIDSVRIAWAEVPDSERAKMQNSWDAAGKAVSDEPEKRTSKSGQATKRKAETGDRFRTLNAFVDATMRELTPSEKIVWFVLFREVRNGVANVSQNDISTRSGLTQPTVSLAIQRLVSRGLVRVLKQGGFRRGQSTYLVRGAL